MFSCELWEILKNAYFEELLRMSVNKSKYYKDNELFHENKPTVCTGIRKDNSWSIGPLWCWCTSKYVTFPKQIWFPSSPTFSRELCWLIKSKILYNQTISFLYVHSTFTRSTKQPNLLAYRNSAVTGRCCGVEIVGRSTK